MRNKIFSFEFVAEKIRGREVVLLFLVALISRLFALHFSQVVEADATSRVLLGEWALDHHWEMASYQWPSLQIYFISFAQFISGDRVSGPVIMSLLFGAGAVIPFYLFTKNFFSKDGAFYTALVFCFTPLIFHNSFVPLSEIYHVFFSMMALWCISEGVKRNDQKIKWALLAGIFATTACGGRFEAWLLCALLCGILLVLREWKMMFVFGIVSAIYPSFWLIYCQLKTGHAFISLEMVHRQNIGIITQQLSPMDLRYRIAFFPFSLLITLTPIIFCVIFSRMPKIFREWKKDKIRFLFTCLFLFFLLFFIYESIGGMLADQHRYTVTLIMLSLPVFSLWFEKGRKGLKAFVTVSLVVFMIPWSFLWVRLPWNWLGFGNNLGAKTIAKIIAATSKEMNAVPYFEEPTVTEITEAMKKNLKSGDGMFCDFWEWNESYFILQQSSRGVILYSSYNAKTHHGDHGRMGNFFNANLKGLIMICDYSNLSAEIKLNGPLLEYDSMPGALLLEPIVNKNHYRLFRYTYIPPELTETTRQQFISTPPLFVFNKDFEYYHYQTLHDIDGMSTIWTNVVNGHRNLNDEIKKATLTRMKEDQAQ